MLPKELTVTGIFETGHYVHDSEFLLVPLFIGQELYGLATPFTASRSRRPIPTTRKQVKEDIENFFKPPRFAQTWIDMNRQFFEAVRLERTVMFFLLFFIVVVAAFGIMNTLITVTVQKTPRDRNHESDRREHLADRLGLSRPGHRVGFSARSLDSAWA